MSNGRDEVWILWKIPDEEEQPIDVGDFHDIGIYPSGELMSVHETKKGVEECIEMLREESPSERFGDSMEDAPYTFTFSVSEVEE